MNIIKRNFLIKNKETIYEIEMQTRNGLIVSFLTLGACIRKIAVKNVLGEEVLLNLSYNSLDDYLHCQEYAGMTIGPNAGRIKDDTLSIHPTLTHNEGNYSLHGGFQNISQSNWDITKLHSDEGSCHLSMHTFQKHELDGWPGNRHYNVSYYLNDMNKLQIQYEATTDQDTYINMTNHTYWNLTGNPSMALRQTLQIHADTVCVNEADHFPSNIRSVNNSCFDLRRPKSLKDVIIPAVSDVDANIIYATSNEIPISNTHHIDCQQLQLSKGMNHGYLLSSNSISNNSFSEFVPTYQCCLADPVSHRSVAMQTDAPGIVVYSGGFIESGHLLSNKKFSCPSYGIALEAQELPTVSSYKLTTPDKPFRRMIQFHITLS